ncbi:Uncharacterised protein g3585 [Pycnogonum litorale]
MSLTAQIQRFSTAKYRELARLWFPTASIFGGSAFAGFIYLTEWRVIADYIPLYNTKYSEEE